MFLESNLYKYKFSRKLYNRGKKDIDQFGWQKILQEIGVMFRILILIVWNLDKNDILMSIRTYLSQCTDTNYKFLFFRDETLLQLNFTNQTYCKFNVINNFLRIFLHMMDVFLFYLIISFYSIYLFNSISKNKSS